MGIDSTVVAGSGKAREPNTYNRLFANAVLHVAKMGIPWRDLPERFGNWNGVWRRFDPWRPTEVWQRLAEILEEPDLKELLLDSTVVKAHASASRSRKQLFKKRRSRPQTWPEALPQQTEHATACGGQRVGQVIRIPAAAQSGMNHMKG